MIPKIPTPKDLGELTRFINDRMERIYSEFSKPWRAAADVDMGGFRLSNLGVPKASTDAARLADVGRQSFIPQPVSDMAEVAVIGLHSARAAIAPTKTRPFYFETDRQALYAASGAAWVYVSGTMEGTLAPDTKPGDLTTTDEGFLFQATDYGHLYRWSGSAWGFAPGDSGSQYIVAGQGNGGLWALCDGSAATCATATGTTASVTTPDLTGDVFLQGASSASAVRVAARATWEAAAKTEDEAAHLHVFNNGGTPTGTPLGTPATVVVQSGTGTTVASDVHYHNDSSANYNTGTGSAHSHALNDTNAQLKVPSEVNGGVPKRIALAWYMRR